MPCRVREKATRAINRNGASVFSGVQQSRHSVVPGKSFPLWQRQDVAAQIGQRLQLPAVRQFDRRQAGEVGIPVSSGKPLGALVGECEVRSAIVQIDQAVSLQVRNAGAVVVGPPAFAKKTMLT